MVVWISLYCYITLNNISDPPNMRSFFLLHPKTINMRSNIFHLNCLLQWKVDILLALSAISMTSQRDTSWVSLILFYVLQFPLYHSHKATDIFFSSQLKGKRYRIAILLQCKERCSTWIFAGVVSSYHKSIDLYVTLLHGLLLKLTWLERNNLSIQL